MIFDGIFSQKRDSRNGIKPLLFATFEIALLIMCIYFISTFNLPIVSAFSYIAAMIYIITTVIPRYKKAKKEQNIS